MLELHFGIPRIAREQSFDHRPEPEIPIRLFRSIADDEDDCHAIQSGSGWCSTYMFRAPT